MGIDVKESLRIAKMFKEKKASGKPLNKGEEVILTLASEYAKIRSQDFKISNELCVDIISVHKERINQSKELNILVDNMEMNMLLEGLLERLNIS